MEKIKIIIDLGDKYFPIKKFEAPSGIYDGVAKLLNQEQKVDIIKILLISRRKFKLNLYQLQKLMNAKSYSTIYKHCQELEDAGLIEFNKTVEKGREKTNVSLSNKLDIYSLNEFLDKNESLFQEDKREILDNENKFISNLRIKMQKSKIGGL
jgi:DNA-binding transcriptional ArsR family regulator